MTLNRITAIRCARDITTWQTFRPIVFVVSLLLATLTQDSASAQLHDALDAYPPRWNLDGSDCQASVISHKHLSDGGKDGRGCEHLVFNSTHGSEALFVYPLEPLEVNDELRANLSVMSAKPGCRIGLRVRFPYSRDDETGKAIAVVLYGADYEDPGKYSTIGVGSIKRPLKLKEIAIRRERGTNADLRDPYVDAVVINAFAGAGTTAVRLDELQVEGMIAVGDKGRALTRLEQSDRSTVMRIGPGGSERLVRAEPRVMKGAFPVNRVARILQYNGEPLAWVRSLGFDGVLLASPPNASILRDAIRNRMLIYAPPPTAPDPNLQPLLEPVAGWYIGSKVALDRRRIQQADQSSKRIRGFPERWQRPIVAAPAESWNQYAPLVDAMIDDLPIRGRGVSAHEEAVEIARGRRILGNRIQSAIGIASLPPRAALLQTQEISRAIGAPPPSSLQWHAMWAQVIRSLESVPHAIVFRSSQSLTSGAELDAQRATALSYINRMVAMIEPWVAQAAPMIAPPTSNPNYRCGRLNVGETDLLLITSIASRGDDILAGDGATIDIALPPTDASKIAWRLTHFSAERLTTEQTSLGPRLRIVSPDVVEIIVLSSDPGVGGELSQSAQRFAQRASSDRYQLSNDLLRQTRQHWNLAASARAASREVPADLLTVATQTVGDAESSFRAGDTDACLRLLRRADAWTLRARWQLSDALMPDWPNPTSCPTLIANATEAHVAWHPLMGEQGWGVNRLTSGSLDEPSLIGEGRWQIGKRQAVRAATEVSLVTRGVFNGARALRATVTPATESQLPGGYEGTTLQISSPSIRIPAGKAFRIDAMVRTIGFGGAHQGVLVYDTTGGQEMGVLVRGRSEWTPVRLYRQSISQADVSVMFEIIGAGEATIDDVALQLWEPKPTTPIPLRPMIELSAKPGDPSTTR